MIETARLLLRPWRAEDVEPFWAMGQDTAVMRHLGNAPSREACAETVRHQNALIERDGTAFWALERRDDGDFIGFCGIKPGPDETPIVGLPEIGWRLARAHWRQGLALEAASACLAERWARGVASVHAITVPDNVASRGLMVRLGMARVPQDFDHPALPAGDPLRRHVHYRIDRPA